jgi:protein tyrosine kinase modulator
MKGALTTGIGGGNGFSLRDGAGALFRRRWLVLLIFATVVVGTAVVTYLLPNKYESRLKILVKNQRVDVAITPEATSGAPAPAVENDVSENQINSEIELLTSKDLLTEVARECGLDRAAPSLWRKSAPDAERLEKAANDLAKDLTVSPVRKANVVSITYSSTSPETAAKVLRSLGELYLTKHLKLNHPKGASDFFKEKADEYESKLQESEKRLTDFQQSNNLVVLSQQKDLTLQKTAEARGKLLESDTALKEATDRIFRIEQQLSTIPKRIITQSRQLPNQYSAERLNTMLVELQNKRAQLLTKFRPDDRSVREVDDQIRITREALSRAEQKTAVEEATDLNPLRQTLEAELSRARLDQTGAQARRDSLTGQVQQYEAALKKLEGDTAKHNDLEREIKESEDNYQLYAKKREEARIADELDRQKITNVSIAEAPTVAQIPTSPNRPLNLVLGLVLAGFLSIASVFSAEMLSDVVHTPRQLEALAGAPVLATVAENSRQMRMRRSERIGAAELNSGVQLAS